MAFGVRKLACAFKPEGDSKLSHSKELLSPNLELLSVAMKNA
jgi:hypothetical protein